MPALSGYENRCPSPPSDYEEEQEEPSEELVGDIPKREVIRLFLNLRKYISSTEETFVAAGEEDICDLWDAVNSTQVADFLVEHDILDVLVLLIPPAHSPTRLREIAAGIMANVASHASIQSLATLGHQMNVIFAAFEAEDDPINLRELMRLFSACQRRKSEDAQLARKEFNYQSFV